MSTEQAEPPALIKFKDWLYSQKEFSDATVSHVLSRVRRAYIELGWSQELDLETGRQRLAKYLTVFPPTEHAAFRHAWKLFVTFAQTVGRTLPTLPGVAARTDPLRATVARALVNLLAELTRERVGARLTCEAVAQLKWDAISHLASTLREGPVVLRVRSGVAVEMPRWHLDATFRPLLKWSQPNASFDDPAQISRELPLVTCKSGAARAMTALSMQQLLGEFGFPVSPRAAAVFQLEAQIAKGRAEDARTSEILAKHAALRAEAVSLAKTGELERLWAARFPETPRPALTAEDVTLLGQAAAWAWNLRGHEQTDRVIAAELNEPGEHGDQLERVLPQKGSSPSEFVWPSKG